MRQFTKGLLTIGLLVVVMVGCNNNEVKQHSTENSKVLETRNSGEVEILRGKYPFPNGVTEMGSGDLVLTTPAGTSRNGKTPTFYIDQNDELIQIGFDADEFDGSRQTFIYVDEVYVKPDNFDGQKDSSIDLQGTMLTPGEHTVSFIQFENDDPNGGAVTSYNEARYEVREKNR